MGLINKTAPYLLMQRAALLSNAGAWYDAFQNNSDLQEQIRERIIERLYEEGTDGNDRVIGYYSFATALNDPRKKFNEPYNFLDTGEFFASLFVHWFTTHIFITADAQKEDDNLFEKYGVSMIDLTESDRKWMSDLLKTRYIEYARSVLFRD
jgi:hypothetical protein